VEHLLELIREDPAIREAFADVELTAHELIADERGVALLVSFRGLHVAPYAGIEASGRTLEWDEVHFWRRGDGGLSRHRVWRDDLLTMRRLGL
jgi:predicted ester cyclase